MDSYPGIAKNSEVPPKGSFGCCKLAHRGRTAMGDILDHDGRPPEQQSFFRVPQQFQEVSRGRGGGSEQVKIPVRKAKGISGLNQVKKKRAFFSL